MNRALLTFILVFSGFCARSQDALTAFTNRADQILRARWGFGVNEIPIYCSTNPLIRYNGGIHNCLQKAVDAYDATNHTAGDFDFPSVFRPQFAVTTNNNCVTAIISNWVEVTTDYPEIMSRPFKDADDSTLSTDDNVRGIGLIIGYKPAVPIFDEFSYASTFNVIRKLHFLRYRTDLPPYTTNQMYIFGLSNIFGCSAINQWPQALPRDVTIYLTNSASITFLNELGGGVTNTFTNGSVQVVLSNQWARYFPPHTNMFRVFSNSTIPLSMSAYMERTQQFVVPTDTNWEFDVGLPVHSWLVQVTNQLVYALVDNITGRVLDFVSYGKFGTSFDPIQTLHSWASAYPSPWLTNGADSSLFSPPSAGVLNQIAIAANGTDVPGYTPQPGASQIFTAFLNGTSSSSDFLSMDAPYVPSATIQQTARWWAATELFRYDPIVSPGDRFAVDAMATTSSLTRIAPMANSTSFNPLSFPGSWLPIQITQVSVDSTNINLQFNSYTDGEYGIWSSTDLINWSFVGLASEVTNNTYTLTTPLGTNSSAQFFEARKQ